MRSVPTAVWTDLLAESFRGVTVFELLLDDGTLRYSSRALTFGGNSYAALAVRASAVEESIERVSPRYRVVFSNVLLTLQSQIEPIDKLTGRELIARLVFFDASGVAKPDSLVLFRGRMERPKRVSETEFEVPVVGPIDAAGVTIPRRRFAAFCPWQYANAGLFDAAPDAPCGYVSTTTTLAETIRQTTFSVADASLIVVGDSIFVNAAARDAVPNRDFELWNSPSNLAAWEKIVAGGTLTQDSGDVFQGSNAARLDRTGASGALSARTYFGLVPGSRYTLSVYAKTTQNPDPLNPALELFNVDRGRYLQSDGTFGTSAAFAVQGGGTPSYSLFSIAFSVPSEFALDDEYRLTLAHDGSVLDAVRYDLASMSGPDAAMTVSAKVGNDLTVSRPATFLGSSAVRLAECDREFSDCEQRERTFDFGGFITISYTARARWKTRSRFSPIEV